MPSISEVIGHRRSALFGHVARLQQDVPAHKAHHCHVDLSLGRPPNDQWKRRPGRPRERWIDQVRKDNGVGIPPARGERQVVVTEEQRYDPCWLRDDDDDDGLLTDMRAFVLHSARAHGVHWPDCANSAKCSDLITDKIHWTSLDKFHKVISFGHHGCGRHGHGLRPIWLWPIRLNPQTSR